MTFVAFGAEEPRGPGDDGHHYGSRVHVDRGSTPRGSRPWCRWTASARPAGCRCAPEGCRRCACAASCSPPPTALGVPARACVNRTSDHWPFEKAGRTVARVGGNDYAGYHSAA